MPRPTPPRIENRGPEKGPGNPAWKKGGPSPNPGGRPKAVAELLDLARSHVPRALRLAARFLRDREMDPRVRLDAAKLVIAYGLGKPPSTSLTGEDDERDNSLVGKDVAQLLEVMRAGKSGDPSAEH